MNMRRRTFLLYFGILLIHVNRNEATESVLYDAQDAGFIDWYSGWFQDTGQTREFVKKPAILNRTTIFQFLRKDIGSDGSAFIYTPIITIHPAWKIKLQINMLHNGRKVEDNIVPLNLYTDKIKSETVSQYTLLTSINSTFKQSIDSIFGNLQKYFYCKFRLSWGATFIPDIRPSNITITKFKITYLHCPARIKNLAKYPDSPAAKDTGTPVIRNGECVEDAEKVSSFLTRHCLADAQEVTQGSCVCKAGKEIKNDLKQACKACDEEHFKPKASEEKCKKCGKNSYDENRLKCPCQSPRFRKKQEENDGTATCFAYPNIPVNAQIQSATGESVTLEWGKPAEDDSELTVTYRIKCIKPLDACKASSADEPVRADITSVTIPLLSFTTYQFQICAHNEVSLSYIGDSKERGKVQCLESVTAATMAGAPSAVRNVGIRMIERSINTIDISWQVPISSGSNSFIYIISYDTANITVESSKTSYLLKHGVTGAPNVTVEIFAISTVGSSQLKGPSSFSTIELNTFVAEAKTDLEAILIGSILGGLAFIVILVLIIYIVYRFRKYERSNRDQILHVEAENMKARYEIEMMRLQINKTARNLYVPLEVLLDPSTRENAYDIEPVYEEIISDYLYDFYNLVEKETLGEGNFAFVLKAKAKNICGNKGDSWVAVKQLKMECNAIDREDFQGELDLMMELKNHENVVKLLGYCKNPNCIILEFLPGGDLLTFLAKSREYRQTTVDNVQGSFLTSDDLLNFAFQVCEGMKYISDNNVVHRDLAARNVLVGFKRTSQEDYKRICKIGDLGLARKLNEDGIYKRDRQARLPVKWMPLESIKYGRSTVKSDVWSFGIVLYEIVTIGGVPYPKQKSKDIPSFLESGQRMPKPPACHDEIYSLMLDCWDADADNRPSFTQLSDRINELRKDIGDNYLNLDMYNEKEAYISLLGADDLHEDEVFLDTEQTGIVPHSYSNALSDVKNRKSNGSTSF